ncbi:Hemolysin-type calcium-binding region [Halothece sp. PCC 7418]|uniref:hemolysin-type calcium-binding protein n=1 Tax=Halothece sp. (strain PCC 7418) TaxID=65093 RepID=UPI0002A089C0|nr:hemolysin-type calcium-binding protein [Halothece sp. PCC 7418]AFZ45595.1 Hemolysin-type calcium-binding region [Halothece sp. PCC 7418]
MVSIGETTALIPQAGSSTKPEHLQDGGSGDTDFPYGNFKALGTVGEEDPENGHVLTGYPDGQAAWLLDDDTVRVAYQSESYATMSNETYPWEMESGVTFTGSHIHAIDYDRAAFADFLNNDTPASEMVEGAGHLFNTVYNVFGEVVDGKNDDPNDLSAKWGNQVSADGTLLEFREEQQLTQGDFFFHSFCGAWYEPANKYGDGIGFEDDVWLMGEEWNIGNGMYPDPDGEDGPLTGNDFFVDNTMGLASMVVDLENETAYTAPALGQAGYEKLLPMNPGSEDYVVIVAAGYNLEVEPAPLTVYIGKKGVDANGDPLTEDASARDSFLGENGLLYGQLYGMSLDGETFENLGIEDVDADVKMMDAYAQNPDAPDTFSARYYPTSYQWDGFDSPENAGDTEVFKWLEDGDDGEPNEQPEGGVAAGGYNYFNGDSKTEHPAVDPDPTNYRYIQNLTVPSAQLGIEFTDLVNELENNDADGNGLPDYLSADVTRILAGVDGELTLETGGKGAAHIGEENPNGTKTHATHVEIGEARMNQPDGLQWVKAADGDYLIVDEDSGNDYGERKYVLPIDSETMQLKEEGKGYFLASAGGALNPRAIAEVAAIPDTFSSATSSEFSGSWNVTHLVETKEDGSFYTQEEIAGTGAKEIISSVPLDEQTLIGVVQHKGEQSGIIEERLADQGGQIFQFNIDLEAQEEEGEGDTPTGGQPAFGSLEGNELNAGVDFFGENNLVFSGGGDDTVDVSTVDSGNRIYTGSASDEVFLGSNNRVFTGAGDDLVDSVLGRENRIYTGAGNDTITAGYEDRIVAGAGNDRFFLTEGEVEGGGDNTVTGGPGEDQFWIATAGLPGAANTITDFTSGEDVLGVAGVGATEIADLELDQDGDQALIGFDGDDLAVLIGVDSTALSDSDFAFV